jgi:hypothetical protein
MLRCGQSKKTFAATAKSGDARIHTLRTNRPDARAAIADAAFPRVAANFLLQLQPAS